ncbi:hypothetical protein AB1Y20_010421 [Prymnesium parvum]|uniref:Uncharacterized protein n=1 Tax=Prymnesium parvum TaxID=97485 RepID=A0AB34INM1_PRYPA
MAAGWLLPLSLGLAAPLPPLRLPLSSHARPAAPHPALLAPRRLFPPSSRRSAPRLALDPPPPDAPALLSATWAAAQHAAATLAPPLADGARAALDAAQAAAPALLESSRAAAEWCRPAIESSRAAVDAAAPAVAAALGAAAEAAGRAADAALPAVGGAVAEAAKSAAGEEAWARVEGGAAAAAEAWERVEGGVAAGARAARAVGGVAARAAGGAARALEAAGREAAPVVQPLLDDLRDDGVISPQTVDAFGEAAWVKFNAGGREMLRRLAVGLRDVAGVLDDEPAVESAKGATAGLRVPSVKEVADTFAGSLVRAGAPYLLAGGVFLLALESLRQLFEPVEKVVKQVVAMLVLAAVMRAAYVNWDTIQTTYEVLTGARPLFKF